MTYPPDTPVPLVTIPRTVPARHHLRRRRLAFGLPTLWTTRSMRRL